MSSPGDKWIYESERSIRREKAWRPNCLGCCASGTAHCCAIGLSFPCAYGRAMEVAGAGNCAVCACVGLCCIPCNAAHIDKRYPNLQGPGVGLSCCLLPFFFWCLAVQQVQVVEGASGKEIGCCGGLVVSEDGADGGKKDGKKDKVKDDEPQFREGERMWTPVKMDREGIEFKANRNLVNPKSWPAARDMLQSRTTKDISLRTPKTFVPYQMDVKQAYELAVRVERADQTVKRLHIYAHGFGIKGAQAISTAFDNNTSLEEIHVNWTQDKGCRVLVDLLLEKVTNARSDVLAEWSKMMISDDDFTYDRNPHWYLVPKKDVPLGADVDVYETTMTFDWLSQTETGEGHFVLKRPPLPSSHIAIYQARRECYDWWYFGPVTGSTDWGSCDFVWNVIGVQGPYCDARKRDERLLPNLNAKELTRYAKQDVRSVNMSCPMCNKPEPLYRHLNCRLNLIKSKPEIVKILGTGLPPEVQLKLGYPGQPGRV